MSYRIWLQSSTPINNIPAYLAGVQDHARQVLSNDFDVDIHGVPEGSTSDLHFMAYEYWNSGTILNNIIRAEEEGYDAVAVHCFLDPVLHEARELVDIPVVSLGETAMIFSLMYGRRFSIITYTPQMEKKRYPNLISKYGLDSRAASIESFEVSLPELANSFSNPEPVIEKFMGACEEAIKNGAEVILPGCGLLNIICIQNQINQVRNTGVTVLDVTGALLKTAETAVKLKEVSGTKISRYGYYEKPENIEQVKKIYTSR